MGVSIWQLVIIIGILVIPFIIFSPILNKAGFSRWWSLCFFVPIVNILMVWVFAFIEWPAEKEHNKSSSLTGAENAPPS